ncbi:MAG: hypothetical protein ACREGJ_02150 [Candidatus Saccharimonadales bacterium]
MQRKYFVILSIVLLLVIAGVAAYFLWPRPSTQVKQKQEPKILKVGQWNYVNACRLLSADDFATVTGQQSDRQNIKTEFVTDTPELENDNKSYESTCVRKTITPKASKDKSAAPVSGHDIKVGVRHFRNTARAEQFMAEERSQPDPSLEAIFGKGAYVNESTFINPSANLYFAYENKIVQVDVNDKQSPNGLRDQAVAAAKLVHQQLTKANRDITTFSLGPTDEKFGKTPYTHACLLFTPADFTKVTRIEAKNVTVEANFGETLPRDEDEVTNDCRLIGRSEPGETISTMLRLTLHSDSNAASAAFELQARFGRTQRIEAEGLQAPAVFNSSLSEVIMQKDGRFVRLSFTMPGAGSIKSEWIEKSATLIDKRL